MKCTRRRALLGASAAVITGAATIPLALKAAGVEAALTDDPVIGLSDQLRAVWKAWMSAQEAFEETAEDILRVRFWDLHARLLDMRATTTGGVLAKLRGFYGDREIATIRTGFDDLPGEWAASIYRDLERLAGEG